MPTFVVRKKWTCFVMASIGVYLMLYYDRKSHLDEDEIELEVGAKPPTDTFYAPSIAGPMKHNISADYYVFKPDKTTFDGLEGCSLPELHPLHVHRHCGKASAVSKALDVTMVTHLTCERIDLFRQMALAWSGPIIVSLFVSDLQQCSSEQLLDVINVCNVHKNMLILMVQSKDQELYPFNALRAIGGTKVITSHLLYLDIDMFPTFSAYSSIKSRLESRFSKGLQNGKFALILPSFELTKKARKEITVNNNLIHYPVQDKDQLLSMLATGVAQPARLDRWYFGHGPTNYDKWKSTNKTYLVKYSLAFEPYVVIPKDAPLPDSRFVGHSRDKSAFVLQLHADGFKFVVVPDLFVLHHEHERSVSKATVSNYAPCNIRAFHLLVQQLRVNATYPKKSKT